MTLVTIASIVWFATLLQLWALCAMASRGDQR
jgi:hypothetical protein